MYKHTNAHRETHTHLPWKTHAHIYRERETHIRVVNFLIASLDFKSRLNQLNVKKEKDATLWYFTKKKIKHLKNKEFCEK